MYISLKTRLFKRFSGDFFCQIFRFWRNSYWFSRFFCNVRAEKSYSWLLILIVRNRWLDKYLSMMPRDITELWTNQFKSFENCLRVYFISIIWKMLVFNEINGDNKIIYMLLSLECKLRSLMKLTNLLSVGPSVEGTPFQKVYGLNHTYRPCLAEYCWCQLLLRSTQTGNAEQSTTQAQWPHQGHPVPMIKQRFYIQLKKISYTCQSLNLDVKKNLSGIKQIQHTDSPGCLCRRHL